METNPKHISDVLESHPTTTELTDEEWEIFLEQVETTAAVMQQIGEGSGYVEAESERLRTSLIIAEVFAEVARHRNEQKETRSREDDSEAE